VPQLAELWLALRDHHIEKSTFFKEQLENVDFPQRLTQLEQKGELGQIQVGIVLNSDDEARGYCIATIVERVGEIESIYVHPDSRGLGLGSKLMHHALEWFERQEVNRQQIYVAEGNEESWSFYARFGFFPRVSILTRLQKSSETL